MTEPKITVTGIEETNAALRAFGERAANDVEVAGQAAEVVAAAARVTAPVLTGALAASYMVSERYVVSDLPYSGPVEFGTDRMEPRYVVSNAMETSAEQVAQMYAEWLAAQADAAGLESKSSG